MAEQLIPPWIIPEDESQEWLDEGSTVFAAQFTPGLTQRQSYGGLRLKLSRRHTVRGEEKARLLAILNQTRGRFNAVRTKVHFAMRGSGLGGELLTNNTFASGTTGWTATGAAVLSASDRVMRITTNAAAVAGFSKSVALSQYAPYALRAMIMDGSQSAGLSIGPFLDEGGAGINGYSTSRGLRTISAVALSASSLSHLPVNIASSTGFSAGAFVSVPYCSLARCALTDAGENLLRWSDQLSAAEWDNQRIVVGSDVIASPFGSVVADTLTEDSSAAATHFDQQSFTVAAAAADVCFAVALKAGARAFARINLIENTGGTVVFTDLNLTTGARQDGSPGANWANLRSFAQDFGGGWFVYWLIARKTNAATSLTARINLCSALATPTYNGNGTSNIYAWRATVARSSLPVRLVLTTTASISGGTQQTGSGLYLKGLPASTNGILLAGDFFEVNGELKQCTAALNSDAAGLGYLQFEPDLVRSPADNDPVILLDPMGKFLVSNIKIDNQFGTQAIVTYDLEHIYD